MTVRAKDKFRGKVVRQIVRAMGEVQGVNLAFVPGVLNPADGPSRLVGGYADGCVCSGCEIRGGGELCSGILT